MSQTAINGSGVLPSGRGRVRVRITGKTSLAFGVRREHARNPAELRSEGRSAGAMRADCDQPFAAGSSVTRESAFE